MRAGIKVAIVLAFAGLVVAVTPVFASERPGGSCHLGADTQERFRTASLANRVGSQSSFIVELTQRADLSRAYGMKDQNARGWFVYRALTRTAEKTQAPIRAMLDRAGVSYRSFWVANGRHRVRRPPARQDARGEARTSRRSRPNDASNWLTATVV